MIRAEVHTDDFAYTAKFDAAPWFTQASAEAIVDLARCEWGGDYPADEVARFHEGRDGYADVSDLFADAQRRKAGFECHVHDQDALAWLRQTRPDVFADVCADAQATPEDLLPIEADAPYWDRDASWAGEYQMEPTAPGCGL